MTSQIPRGHRLVLDLQGLQSQHHGDRGIGRYVREHAKALLACDCVDALMLSPDLPFPRHLDPALLTSPLLRWNTMSVLRGVVDGASKPLVYHIMSSFEISTRAESDISGHVLRSTIPIVATLYDLIPLVLAERYLHDRGHTSRYLTRKETLRSSDLVLAISEHTARDAIEHLQLDPARVKCIGSGVSPFFHRPPSTDAADLVLRRNVPQLTGPFVLTVSGGDPRKNTERLIEAWAALAPHLREEHQLVLACAADPGILNGWQEHAASQGVGGNELVFTGWISDEVLRALYQRARLFVFPSLYEGYGLPTAEAIACGCPAITSNSSSLPEVLSWPASTFDPFDVSSIASSLERALTDDAHRRELCERGSARLPDLTWAAVAERTLDALTGLPEASSGKTRLPVRVALVGPMPPMASGIADYNSRLVPHLAQRCQLDVFTPAPRPVHPPAEGVRWFPPAALSRSVSPWSYDLVVYTIGNSDDHHDLFEQAEEYPGLLWLHDVRLPGLYITYARERMPEGLKRDFLVERLHRQYRRRLPRYLDLDITAQPPHYVEAGIGMSQELVAIHRGVVVSSRLAERILTLDQQPDAPRPKTWVVPHAVPEPTPRARETDERTVVSFGMVSPVKAPVLVIHAFARAMARLGDETALLAFVGLVSEADRGDLQEVAGACGVADRVRFTGYSSWEDYDAWLSRATCAIQLRLTTNGESSGAVHECIANGIPVITNVASTVELPPDVVEVVPADVEADDLAARLIRILTDPEEVVRRRSAQRAYTASWGFADVAERILEIVAELGHASMANPASQSGGLGSGTSCGP